MMSCIKSDAYSEPCLASIVNPLFSQISSIIDVLHGTKRAHGLLYPVELFNVSTCSSFGSIKSLFDYKLAFQIFLMSRLSK